MTRYARFLLPLVLALAFPPAIPVPRRGCLPAGAMFMCFIPTAGTRYCNRYKKYSIPAALHGLGIRDGALYVCDGADGLKVYKVKQACYPVLQLMVTGAGFYACIPHDNLLICMTEGGDA